MLMHQTTAIRNSKFQIPKTKIQIPNPKCDNPNQQSVICNPQSLPADAVRQAQSEINHSYLLYFLAASFMVKADHMRNIRSTFSRL